MEAPRIKQALVKEPVSSGFLVLTISDTRTRETDKGGPLIIEYLQANGHRVEGYEIVRDDPEAILAALRNAASNPAIAFCLLTGGTGISPRDNTYETLLGYVDREITGFGEIFRMLSWHDIGSPSILSRAMAGVKGRQAIVSLPGSTAAIRLAMEKLVLPEVGHIVGELSKPG